MGLQRYLLIFALTALVSSASAQETRYVSDALVITLRSGPSTQNQIVENLSSGASVRVLEELPDEGYSHVRTADGTEGWVISRYLQAAQTAAQRLVVAERELASARDRLASLEIQVGDLSGDLGQTRTALAAAETSGQGLSEELEDIRTASANAVALRDQNESLRRRVTELTAQVDVVAMDNAELRSRSRQNWFVVGAAVLFGGVVIGLIAPTLRPRRKSSW